MRLSARRSAAGVHQHAASDGDAILCLKTSERLKQHAVNQASSSAAPNYALTDPHSCECIFSPLSQRAVQPASTRATRVFSCYAKSGWVLSRWITQVQPVYANTIRALWRGARWGHVLPPGLPSIIITAIIIVVIREHWWGVEKPGSVLRLQPDHCRAAARPLCQQP